MKLTASAFEHRVRVAAKATVVLGSLVIFLLFASLPCGICGQEDLQGNTLGSLHGGQTRWTETSDGFRAVAGDAPVQGVVRMMEKRVKFESPGVQKVQLDRFSSRYDRVDMKGLAKWDGQPGSPLLPVKPLRILIPYKHQVGNVKVFKGPRTELVGEFLVEPVQQAVPISHSRDAEPTPPDPLIYESDGAHPPLPCGDVLIQKTRGFTILTVNLFPVEYHPRSGRISYYPEMRVQVKAYPQDGGDGLDSPGIVPDSGYADEIRGLVENPEVVDTYSEDLVPPAQTLPQSEGSALPQGMFEYVIITNNNLRDGTAGYAFQDLIDTKMLRGLTATLVTVEDHIYPHYAGTEDGDDADRIRQFIADAYTNWGTRWVLLGGDVEIIPKRGVYVSTGSYVQTSMPTDLYYACLDGPWNFDGDAYWGEYNDGPNGGDVDLSAEIFIGRASVSNASEVSNFVAKTIQYETLGHLNEKTAVWLGEQLDGSTWGSYSSIPIKDQCLPGEWHVVERYDSAGGWSGSVFIDDLNASPHIITHLGHANETYNARIYNSNVAALTNQDPYIMYSQGCNSGSFDTHDRSIAEQHTVSSGGAVAVVMNARYGWYAPGSYPAYSHYYALEFWDAAFNEDKIHFGQANQDAREDNLFRVGSTGTYRWIHFETNLFGDPETSFQLPPPTLPSEIRGMVVDDLNKNGVQDAGEYGVAGELVFLDHDNDGSLDNGEPTATTAADGRYSFSDLGAGTYIVRHSLLPYWEHTSPVTGFHEVSPGEGEVIEAIDFLMAYFPPTPPEAPANLSAAALSESEIDLTWEDRSDNEARFKIERSMDGVSFTEVAHVDANVTQYTDSNLLSDTTYTYRVRASNEGGDSDYSNEAWATTDAPPPPEILISYVKPDTGEAGDGVRIGGNNFGPMDGSSRVYFDGAQGGGDAPVVLWKDGLIKCTVPALPEGQYGLTIITSFGQSDSVPFTIFSSSEPPPPPPPPGEVTITSLSTSEGPPGTSLRIKGVNFGNPDGSSRVLFQDQQGREWEAPVSLWRDGQIKCTVPDVDPGEYSVTVVTSSSTSNAVPFTVF